MIRSVVLAALVVWGVGIPVWAHGVELGFSTTEAIEVQARYDTGEPMANAQVTVFAPQDPAVPWLTGQTDAQGRFWFRPDPAQAGSWQVRIRQAGHGGMLTIPVDPPPAAQPEVLSVTPAEPTRLSPGLRVAMAASWVWGLVGTALFFARVTRKVPHAPS